VPQRIVIRLGGAIVADTRRALRVLETHHAPTYYLPPEDIGATLTPARGNSFCEWKGVARYFDVTAGSATAARAAWAYDQPTAGFAALAGYVAFYAALMDEAWVGDLQVLPQPGNFYGGWVTANLEGRIKGAPGTQHAVPCKEATRIRGRLSGRPCDLAGLFGRSETSRVLSSRVPSRPAASPRSAWMVRGIDIAGAIGRRQAVVWRRTARSYRPGMAPITRQPYAKPGTGPMTLDLAA
jgi:uncharacterized protein (DUF427 family)